MILNLPTKQPTLEEDKVSDETREKYLNLLETVQSNIEQYKEDIGHREKAVTSLDELEAFLKETGFSAKFTRRKVNELFMEIGETLKSHLAEKEGEIKERTRRKHAETKKRERERRRRRDKNAKKANSTSVVP